MIDTPQTTSLARRRAPRGAAWGQVSLRHNNTVTDALCPLCLETITEPREGPEIFYEDGAPICPGCAERFCPELLAYKAILWHAISQGGGDWRTLPGMPPAQGCQGPAPASRQHQQAEGKEHNQ